MADITLSISRDGLIPSVVDVARKGSLSVGFSGLDAWRSTYQVENGTVYVQQFDALMRPLREDAFSLGSFTVTLKAGVCAMDFRVRADSTTVSGNAMYDVPSAFPVKVYSSDSGIFPVGLTYEDDVPYLDKTWQEIYDAMSEGKIPVVVDVDENEAASANIFMSASETDDGYELEDVHLATWYAETVEDYPHVVEGDGES